MSGWFRDKEEIVVEPLPGLRFLFRVEIAKTIGGQEKVMLNPIVDREPLPEDVRCKSCGSGRLYRHGFTKGGVQRYKCRACKLTFIGTDTLPRMRVPVAMVGAAVSMFYEGLSLNAIRRQMNQIYGIYPSDSTVYEWIVRFTRTAVRTADGYTPKVGRTWTADETVLKVGGQNIWFWDIIDEDTRFLLASHLTPSRFTRDAETLMRRALDKAGRPPRVVVTDKLRSYLDGIERVFGSDTRHVQSGPFKLERSTRSIERFHGTLKDRTKVMRGMANRETAKLVMEGWLVHYNYLRPHQGLGGRTPAQAARVSVPFKTWADVVRMETP